MSIITSSGSTQQVTTKDHFFYLDGEKFFIKGIGYELSALPGQVPWNKTFDPAQIRFDIQRILDGGFNTIRTWAPFTKQELDVLKEFDIKIIMGIWIAPDGDFGDPQFIQESKNIVTDVLNYSKNYPNIIAYLIMNEPLPEHLADAGYQNAINLWSQLIQIIHTKHPGRPVSIANTPPGDFVDPKVFDYSAYNVYNFNPVTVDYTHQYTEYIRYLEQIKPASHPLVISEYGLAVNPTGPGNWGYAGNSLEDQASGLKYMYQSLIDGGATGSCIFIYADGWWKGGNEWAHDDSGEEWLGLVEYASLNDKQGTTRPAWDTIKAYQSVIITEPKSGSIYGTSVPIELFPNAMMGTIEVWEGDNKLKSISNTGAHLLTYLQLDGTPYRDVVLRFKCYNRSNVLVKTEEKNILVATQKPALPSIKISLSNEDYWHTLHVSERFTMDVPAPFKRTSDIEYGFYPHIGWYYGVPYHKTTSSTRYSFTQEDYFSDAVPAFTVAAGFDVTLGTFKRRIANLLTISELNQVVSSRIVQTSNARINIKPNPAQDVLYIERKAISGANVADYQIYDVMGHPIQWSTSHSWTDPISILSLPAGIYILRLQMTDEALGASLRFVKL